MSQAKVSKGGAKNIYGRSRRGYKKRASWPVKLYARRVSRREGREEVRAAIANELEGS